MASLQRNSERFIEIYNILDNYMRMTLEKPYGYQHFNLIEEMSLRDKVFNRQKDILKRYGSLRNAIVHKPNAKLANPIAEPHDNIVRDYEKIVDYVLNPPTAMDSVAIKTDKIYTTSLEDCVIKVMKDMSANTYTHVPVMEGNKLVGIFSENTIFNYITDNEDVILEKDMKIKDFMEYLPIDKHKSEFFEFVSRKATLVEVEERFKEELKENRRLAVVFITENGKPNEKIHGIITAWDIAGYDR